MKKYFKIMIEQTWFLCIIYLNQEYQEYNYHSISCWSHDSISNRPQSWNILLRIKKELIPIIFSKIRQLQILMWNISGKNNIFSYVFKRLWKNFNIFFFEQLEFLIITKLHCSLRLLLSNKQGTQNLHRGCQAKQGAKSKHFNPNLNP